MVLGVANGLNTCPVYSDEAPRPPLPAAVVRWAEAGGAAFGVPASETYTPDKDPVVQVRPRPRQCSAQRSGFHTGGRDVVLRASLG